MATEALTHTHTHTHAHTHTHTVHVHVINIAPLAFCTVKAFRVTYKIVTPTGTDIDSTS